MAYSFFHTFSDLLWTPICELRRHSCFLIYLFFFQFSFLRLGHSSTHYFSLFWGEKLLLLLLIDDYYHFTIIEFSFLALNVWRWVFRNFFFLFGPTTTQWCWVLLFSVFFFLSYFAFRNTEIKNTHTICTEWNLHDFFLLFLYRVWLFKRKFWRFDSLSVNGMNRLANTQRDCRAHTQKLDKKSEEINMQLKVQTQNQWHLWVRSSSRPSPRTESAAIMFNDVKSINNSMRRQYVSVYSLPLAYIFKWFVRWTKIHLHFESFDANNYYQFEMKWKKILEIANEKKSIFFFNKYICRIHHSSYMLWSMLETHSHTHTRQNCCLREM